MDFDCDPKYIFCLSFGSFSLGGKRIFKSFLSLSLSLHIQARINSKHLSLRVLISIIPFYKEREKAFIIIIIVVVVREQCSNICVLCASKQKDISFLKEFWNRLFVSVWIDLVEKLF